MWGYLKQIFRNTIMLHIINQPVEIFRCTGQKSYRALYQKYPKQLYKPHILWNISSITGCITSLWWHVASESLNFVSYILSKTSLNSLLDQSVWTTFGLNDKLTDKNTSAHRNLFFEGHFSPCNTEQTPIKAGRLMNRSTAWPSLAEYGVFEKRTNWMACVPVADWCVTEPENK